MGIQAAGGIGNLPVEDGVGFFSWNVPENRVFGDDVIGYIFALSREELAVGVPIEHVIRFVDDGDKQNLAKAIHHSILFGHAFQENYSVTHEDGRRVYVSAAGKCLRDQNDIPSLYSGTATIMMPEHVLRQLADDGAPDALEDHCRAALGIARRQRNTLAARYISSALNVLGARTEK